MNRTKYLILGAGPAGLSLAHTLLAKGEQDIVILEKENEAGGLCRSKDVDGSALDIGGGHFLDVRRPAVNEFLFRFMPEEEWDRYERDSKIHIDGQMISHPLEANIWQMDIESQLKYLMSVSRAGCVTGTPVPEAFVDWIRWKLGDEIADKYMIPYNMKMFGEDLNELGTYWLNKLPDVSFEDVLRSCLEHKAHAKQPGHASFYYPKKYGYGELWRRMAEALGDKLISGAEVSSLDLDGKKAGTTAGELYEAECIITTIPWTCLKEIKGLSDDLKQDIGKLKHTGVVISYCPETLDTGAHWIYEPDPDKTYHRILVRHNFCPGSRGYWKETRRERFVDEGTYSYLNEYAYPLNTIDKPSVMKKLIGVCTGKNVYPLGRWGEHEHYNSDAVVERAISLGNDLADKNA